MDTKIYLTGLIFGLAMSIVFAQPGASTPNELFKLAAKAINENNFEAFRPLYKVGKKLTEKDLDAMIGVMKLHPRLKSFLDNGRKKFENDFNNEVVDRFNLELDAATNWAVDFEKASGQQFKISQMADEIMATTSATWVNPRGESINASYVVSKYSDRWFFSLPKKRIELLEATTQFIYQSEIFLNQAKSATELADKMKPLRNQFDIFFEY